MEGHIKLIVRVTASKDALCTTTAYKQGGLRTGQIRAVYIEDMETLIAYYIGKDGHKYCIYRDCFEIIPQNGIMIFNKKEKPFKVASALLLTSPLIVAFVALCWTTWGAF